MRNWYFLPTLISKQSIFGAIFIQTYFCTFTGRPYPEIISISFWDTVYPSADCMHLTLMKCLPLVLPLAFTNKTEIECKLCPRNLIHFPFLHHYFQWYYIFPVKRLLIKAVIFIPNQYAKRAHIKHFSLSTQSLVFVMNQQKFDFSIFCSFGDVISPIEEQIKNWY